MIRIGVISDTHGYFDPDVPAHFRDVDHIFHAGDIGSPAILHQLEALAPVTAVLGNTDSPLPGIRETEYVRLGETGFLLHHIVDPDAPSEVLRRQLTRHRPQVVIYGHTHRHASRSLEGVLYFNPGAAGRSRFGQRRSLAVLELDGAALVSRPIWLPDPS